MSEGLVTVCRMSEFASETNEADNNEAETIGASSGVDQDPALQKDPSDWVSGDDR